MHSGRLWSLLVWRVWQSPNPLAPLVLIAETSIALFVLFRRPTEQLSMRLGDGQAGQGRMALSAPGYSG